MKYNIYNSETSDVFSIDNNKYIILNRYNTMFSYNDAVSYESITTQLKLPESKKYERKINSNNMFLGNTVCLIISNKCNMRCKYCYSASGFANKMDYISEERLVSIVDSFFESYKIARHFPKAKPPKFLFHGGGEPTYNWKLFEFAVQYIQKKAATLKCTVILKLITNGIFDEEKAFKIAQWFDEVIFSIDGPHYINDYNRPLANGGCSTALIEKSIKIVSEYTVVGIHSVVSGMSLGKGQEITQYFIDNFPRVGFIQYEVYRPTRDGNNMVSGISSEEFCAFLDDSIKIGKKLIKSTLIDFKCKKTFCRSCNGEIAFCFPNGNITICNEHDCDERDTRYVIGETVNLKVDYDKFILTTMETHSHQNKLQCKKCFAYIFCAGGCKSMYSQCDDFEKIWCEPLRHKVRLYFKKKLSEALYTEFDGKEIRYIVFNEI